MQAVASTGDTDRARSLIQEAFQRTAWDPPGVESYNALLAGMIQNLKKGEAGMPRHFEPCYLVS